MNLRFKSSMLRFCTILLTAAGASGVWAAPAPDANSVLILSTTDGGSAYSAEASAQGFTAVVEAPANWGTYTQADFASFRAIILGDPTCGSTGAIAAAEGNRADWSAAVGDGPKILIGTDEQFHSGAGGAQLVASGISFVTSEPAQTGLYLSLSCYYHGTATGTPVPVLDQFGAFTVGATPGCFDDAHIVASHPALSGTTDASLSGWGCSVHEVFNSFPGADFIPLAIAEGVTGPGEMSFGDGTSGIPYILASGAGIVPVGEAAAIPTLSIWALALLAGMLGLAALRNFRRIAP